MNKNLRVQYSGSSIFRICFADMLKIRNLLLLKLSCKKIKVVEINALRKFPRNNINVYLSNSCYFHDARILGNKV